jgi:hypothetical protein
MRSVGDYPERCVHLASWKDNPDIIKQPEPKSLGYVRKNLWLQGGTSHVACTDGLVMLQSMGLGFLRALSVGVHLHSKALYGNLRKQLNYRLTQVIYARCSCRH